jgi:hypothetical protein
MKKKIQAFLALMAKGVNYGHIVLSNGGDVYIPSALL